MFINMNKHILTGTLAAKLWPVGMVKTTHCYWGDSEPNTYIDRLQPIDSVYHSQDLKVMVVAQLSFHKGVSNNHHTVLVDISTRSMIGQQEYRVIRPTAW
jgi:hypothetical protein